MPIQQKLTPCKILKSDCGILGFGSGIPTTVASIHVITTTNAKKKVKTRIPVIVFVLQFKGSLLSQKYNFVYCNESDATQFGIDEVYQLLRTKSDDK